MNHVSQCRSCSAFIVWLKTKNEKTIPVDADTVQPDDTVYNPPRHVAHFATCPQAKRWSRRKKQVDLLP